MKTYSRSYVRAFTKFAESSLEKQKFLRTLSVYALSISDKANELIQRAALNSRIDLQKLSKEIYQLGIAYIHKFNHKYRQYFGKDVNRD